MNNYLIHHQGGGWCTSLSNCYDRAINEDIGSSKNWQDANCTAGSEQFPCTYDGEEGLASSFRENNSLTFNWNHMFIGYCDGASYAGGVVDPVHVDGQSAETFVYYRGRYILDGLYDSFIQSRGMSSAKKVIISGTSAGGLAVYLHADYLAGKIQAVNKETKVVAVPDAGFFMDLPAISGEYLYTPIYKNVFSFQNVSFSVNSACVTHYSSIGETWKCFMAQYTLPFIKTPLFIVNSLVDSWQGSNIMGLMCNPDTDCDQEAIDYLNNFREGFLDSLDAFLQVLFNFDFLSYI